MTECVNHIRATAAKKRQQSKDLVIIMRQAGGAVCGNFQSRVHVTTTSISSSHTSENQNCIIISAYKCFSLITCMYTCTVWVQLPPLQIYVQ